MSRRGLGRLARILAQLCVAVALLADVTQQLTLGTDTSELLVSLGTRIARPGREEPPPHALAARVATVAVSGVAWLAMVSLPYAESLEAPPESSSSP